MSKDLTMTRDTACFMGNMPDDVDQIPITPPSGFFWAMPGFINGEFDTFPVSEVRLCLNGETHDFTITLDDARALADLLSDAIEVMEDAPEIAETLSADLQSKSPAGQRAPSDEGTLT
ncbi:hypothetical protein [Roseovarius sp. MMSF_3281]|uniref:hypothetical protein n=1 Tax=Roseovarius sp. MMSF_3281 TaxID=3046694 RepID=UPI00273F1D6C|nr:hypothetical protein [Roseovarius sp. MMSF_3281]